MALGPRNAVNRRTDEDARSKVRFGIFFFDCLSRMGVLISESGVPNMFTA